MFILLHPLPTAINSNLSIEWEGQMTPHVIGYISLQIVAKMEGPLMGVRYGACRFNKRNGNVPCCYFWNFPVGFK